ncbi:MAG: carbohydrate ABC transporter permease [Oscillospiraceae bacterium]|nr:carbohydrate ABC transporter permease [Oscillospiraceae bacterium]
MKKVRTVILYLLFALLSLAILYPVVLVILLSVQDSDELAGTISPLVQFTREYADVHYLPQYPTLGHFTDLLIFTPEFYTVFWNSLLMVGIILLFQLVVAVPSAWAFARFRFRGKNLLFNEKLEDTELNNIQKAEFLIEDCADRGIHFLKEDTDKILDFAGDREDIHETAKLVSDMEEIQKQRDSYGYDFTYMTPIDTKEEALAAYDRGEAVYLLYPDNTEGMAESRSEIENFDGYFGIEKEPSRDVAREQSSELIPVSKEVALEMWDKDLDVYIDGVRAEKREEIENAPLTAKLYLSEFQYAAQLDFEKSQSSNVQKKADEPKKTDPVSKNPNVIGNTPYDELGDKSELQYYPKLKSRHAANIAKQLDEDGVRFSGLKNGWVTTITINKADIPKYEAAVEKVKAMYNQNKMNGSCRALVGWIMPHMTEN